MFDMAKALSQQPGAPANSIAIVTNAGGAGVLTADYCEGLGVKLAKLDSKIFSKIEHKMHHAYSRSNPLDIIGDALPERYELAIDAVLSSKKVAGLIVIQTLQTMTDSLKDAQVIINAHKKHPDKPIISTYMGGKFSRPGVELLEQNGIPDYNDPFKASRVMKALIDRGRIQRS
jgi:acetyltransferase